MQGSTATQDIELHEKEENDKKHTGNLPKKNKVKKCLLTLDLKLFRS